MRLNIVGLRVNLNFTKNLLSFFYNKLTGKVYTGPFSALEKYSFKNYKVKLGSDDVLIGTVGCGFCGSDAKILNYDFSLFSSAFINSQKTKEKHIYLGHEILGKVVSVGKNVKNFKIGNLVTIDSMNRKYNLRKNKFGGWSNYLIRDKNQVIKLKKNKNLNKLYFVEPLACAIQPTKLTNHRNKKVLIIGMGTIGLCVASVLRYFFKDKIKIYITSNNFTDLNKIKKNIFDKIFISKDLIEGSARALKTKVESKYSNKILKSGFDIIYDCSGSKNIFNKILRVSGFRSTIFLMSMNMKKVSIDPTPIWQGEKKIIGIHGYDFIHKNENTLILGEKLILNSNFISDNFSVKKIKFNSWKKFINQSNPNTLKKVLFF